MTHTPTKRQFIFSLAFTLFAIGIIISAGLPQEADFIGKKGVLGIVAPSVGAIAPPFNANLLTGERFTWEQLTQQPLVLNFWATWCAPCIAEMPELERLQADYPQIRVIGVNLAEPAPMVKAFIASLGITYAIALDESSTIALMYRLRGQPMTVIINEKGQILHIFYGATTAEAIAQFLPPIASSQG